MKEIEARLFTVILCGLRADFALQFVIWRVVGSGVVAGGLNFLRSGVRV